MNLPRRIRLARTFSNFFSATQNSLVSSGEQSAPRKQVLADQRERILPLLHLGRVARVRVRGVDEEEGVVEGVPGCAWEDVSERLLEGLTLK